MSSDGEDGGRGKRCSISADGCVACAIISTDPVHSAFVNFSLACFSMSNDVLASKEFPC